VIDHQELAARVPDGQLLAAQLQYSRPRVRGDLTARQGVAYVPYFPLGGFSPLQSDTLRSVADRLGLTPMTVALAWLLQRSPNILLIPGTSSVEHLRENIAAAALELPADVIAELDAIGRPENP
jgi:pyridoxine 4-dehydrogenase